MDVKDRSKMLLDELFKDAASDTRAEKYKTNNMFVSKSIELLEEQGYEIVERKETMPFSHLIMSNVESGYAAMIVYAGPDAHFLLDDKGNEFCPLIYQMPIGSTKRTEPDFLADFLAKHMWGEETKSTGYKFSFGE